MMQEALFIGLGILLLCLLFLATRSRWGAPAQPLSQVEQALRALEWELLPPRSVERVFSSEDHDFILRKTSPQIQRLFEEERRKVALLWLHHTRSQVARLMDFHLEAARQNVELKETSEITLALDYARFLFVYYSLSAAFRLRGPFRVRRLADYAVTAATRMCLASEGILAAIDHASGERLNTKWME
ncbi:MAG TPA: hypothetical protein VG033_06705 [Candidatus Acidoferrales bacterium]|nr:hypothetical protein [Candidatus Acidoferrales bacterium]